MKRIILFLIVVICSIACSQVLAQDSLSKKGDLIVGARVGLSIFDMRYSSYDLSIYHHHYGVREQIGLFAEYDYLWNGLSLRFDMIYSPRGVNLTWKDIDYRLRSYYFDIRVPISYTFRRDKKIQPYVTFAPNVNFVLAGKASYFSDYSSYILDISKASSRSVDFSLFFGVGVKVPITLGEQRLYVGGEFGYNLGLVNTFSYKELDNVANAVNLPTYEVNGTRKNGGFELMATVAWVLPHKDVRRAPEKKTAPEQQPETEVVQPEPEHKNMVEYQPKECYSVEEMQAFITLKMPIDDKRICMFDLKFEFASAVLKKDSEKQLDKFVELFQKYPNMTIQINGHTDNVGSDEYNQKLSENRAKSVYNYFIKKGIPSHRMSIKGFGSKYPIETNETDEGRAKNRRVEVDIQM